MLSFATRVSIVIVYLQHGPLELKVDKSVMDCSASFLDDPMRWTWISSLGPVGIETGQKFKIRSSRRFSGLK